MHNVLKHTKPFLKWAGTMPVADLKTNLRLLCSYQKSISEVCRRTAINRQQFNRYLSGATRPSAHNLQKICRFFELDEYELLLPHEHFRDLLRARDDLPLEPETGQSLAALVERALAQDMRELRRYEGFYFSYFHSLGWQGRIMRSLVCFYEHDSRMYVKSIERFRDPRGKDRYTMKYDGLVTTMSNRLFVFEYESLLGGAVATTILNTTYRSHITLLTGITLAASTGRRRAPGAARVVYQYLGKTVDRRATLAACGAFPEKSAAVNAEIKRLIRNTVSTRDKVLLSSRI